MVPTASAKGEREVLEATRSIRIPVSLWDRFDAAARAQHRTRGAQARFLIERDVEEYESRRAAA
jgi:predicted DNA-binding protein